MVKISDCSCQCRDTGKEKQIEERALSSVNKILGTEGQAYYPDGTGAVTIPIADADQLAQIGINTEDITALEKTAEKTTADISQMKISIRENLDEIEKIQAVDDAQNTEISAIKASDGSRDTRITGLEARATATEGDISDLRTVDATHTSDITALKSKAQQQATQISGLDALCDSITKSLVTDVEVSAGTDAGSFIVSVIEEDGTRRSSDNFQYGRVGTFALEQGSQAGYVRGVLTLVDGTTVTSNDFQILAITGTDVYVTSITLQPDYQAGTIGGTIGYSNGGTQAINAIEVPTAPGVTGNINDLLKRMSAVETKNNSQDASINDLTTRVTTLEAEPGVEKFSNSALGTVKGSTADGKISANPDGTGSVNGWGTVKSDIASKASQADLNTVDAAVKTKASQADLNTLTAAVGTKANQADLNALATTVGTKASQADLTTLQAAVQDCFNDVSYDSTTQKMSFTALDGQVNEVGPIGGEGPSWNTITISDFNDNSNWEIGDEFIIHNCTIDLDVPSSFHSLSIIELYGICTSKSGNNRIFSTTGRILINEATPAFCFWLLKYGTSGKFNFIDSSITGSPYISLTLQSTGAIYKR